ncbi:MAG: amidohydrolase [Clostridiales bacterium]|nr:amidohydrolase [Clostridiales bacterium]
MQENIKNYRRELHLIPESGFKEIKTQNYIINKLKQFGVEFEKVAGTGIVAVIEGEDQSKAIAYRTDIDGLGVNEENSHDFISSHKSMMHACGHDGHMAMALGTIKFLIENKIPLKMNVVFIFQPAEEGPGGAERIIAEGVLEKYNVMEIFGYHVFPDVEEGFFSTVSGPLMARTGEFDIDIYTKTAHGAMPHKGVDAAILASELLLKFQTIISRSIDPIEPAVLTVGKIVIGEMRNVIAGKARMEGTIRTFNEEVYKSIKDKMNIYAKLLESDIVKVEVDFRDMYPAVVNDVTLVDDFRQAVGAEKVLMIKPQMIAEDFSYYQTVIPGIFVFVGIKNEEKGFNKPLHSSTFDFDEKILLNGVEGFLRYLSVRGAIDGE